MAKQLTAFEKSIIAQLLASGMILSLILSAAMLIAGDQWSRKTMVYQSLVVRALLQRNVVPARAKIYLSALPNLECVIGNNKQGKPLVLWKKKTLPAKALDQALKDFNPTHGSAALPQQRQQPWLSSLTRLFSHEVRMGTRESAIAFFFPKSPAHLGRYRLWQHNVLMQFDFTPFYLLTVLPLILFMLAMLALFLAWNQGRIKQIHSAMTKALSSIEDDLKEIFLGNFSVMFSARQFTFTQRVANIMNQMLYFFNQHAQRRENESQRDGLTGLYTRRYFMNIFEKELNRCQRHQHRLVFLLLDIDHFKKFNDTYGHLMGDKILQQTAHLIMQDVGESGITARYGGEEIAVLMAESDLNAGVAVAEKLRHLISEAVYAYQNRSVNVTVSIGVAERRGDNNEIVPQIIKRADEALYEAKQAGRNQVKIQN